MNPKQEITITPESIIEVMDAISESEIENGWIEKVSFSSHYAHVPDFVDNNGCVGRKVFDDQGMLDALDAIFQEQGRITRHFTMSPRFFNKRNPRRFSDMTAPSYLKRGGRKGSTMDMRWFWDDHVMTLKLGDSVDTDFQTVTRVA